MKESEYYAKKRDKILDQIIKLREEYDDCYPKSKKGELPRAFKSRTMNEVLKYAMTQDPPPSIPKRYLVDLAANIPVHMKINSFIGLLEKTYDISKQEREFLYSIEKDYSI